MNFIAILIFLLLLIPVISQFFAGNSAPYGFIKMKFWKICIVNILLQLVMIVINIGLFSYLIEKYYYNYQGISGPWIAAISLMLIMLLYIVIAIQAYANIQDK